ncbi:MAG: ferrous iron transport protein A [Rhodospirillales bacterium]|nr:ferrous iron transport protein A [Rhodospirillales bacterium]
MQADPHNLEAKAFPLALAQGGERLRIAAFKTGKGLGMKLSTLGLHVGSEVEVLHRQINGSVVVSRDSNRVALGAGMAQKIMVTLSPQETKGDGLGTLQGTAV